MHDTFFSLVPSPIGELLLTSSGEALTGLWMKPPGGWSDRHLAGRRDDSPLAAARQQLEAYFAGELFDFDVPLAVSGTEFQRHVWTALRGIPYGTTASYAQIAESVGRPTATRAVGAANGQNPISIIVPCHRVIGKDGTLTGYGGGLDRKQWLLRHEATVVGQEATACCAGAASRK